MNESIHRICQVAQEILGPPYNSYKGGLLCLFLVYFLKTLPFIFFEVRTMTYLTLCPASSVPTKPTLSCVCQQLLN